MLQNPYGTKIYYPLKIWFDASNNEVEYEELIAGLGLAKDVSTKRLKVFLDSTLVIQQVKGECEAEAKGWLST